MGQPGRTAQFIPAGHHIRIEKSQYLADQEKPNLTLRTLTYTDWIGTNVLIFEGNRAPKISFEQAVAHPDPGGLQRVA